MLQTIWHFSSLRTSCLGPLGEIYVKALHSHRQVISAPATLWLVAQLYAGATGGPHASQCCITTHAQLLKLDGVWHCSMLSMCHLGAQHSLLSETMQHTGPQCSRHAWHHPPSWRNITTGPSSEELCDHTNLPNTLAHNSSELPSADMCLPPGSAGRPSTAAPFT